jgi:hypothetical protein
MEVCCDGAASVSIEVEVENKETGCDGASLATSGVVFSALPFEDLPLPLVLLAPDFVTGIESATLLAFRRLEVLCSFVVAALFLDAVAFFLASVPRVTLVEGGAAGGAISTSPRPKYSATINLVRRTPSLSCCVGGPLRSWSEVDAVRDAR